MDEVEAIERFFGANAIVLACKAEGAGTDGDIEVLADFVLIDDLAHTKADLVLAVKFAPNYVIPDFLQIQFGGHQ